MSAAPKRKQSEDSPKPVLLRGGVPQHQLTTEERRRGAERTNQIKRERREQMEEQAQQLLDSKLVEVLADWLEQGKEDWRAYQAFLHETYGKPGQRVEVTGEGGGPLEVNNPDVAEAIERFTDSVVSLAQRGRAELTSGDADTD